MPLFIYKCKNCDAEIEKFQHDGGEVLDVVCKVCGCEECEKQMPFTNNRTILNANDFYSDKIKPDADRILNNAYGGKDRDFLDICGE